MAWIEILKKLTLIKKCFNQKKIFFNKKKCYN